MKLWPGATAPAGYLLCDGAAVSRTTYAALYSALGGASSPWGQGDGSTTFNVPDMRGRAPKGAGQGTGLTNRALGATTGTETHLLTSAESGVPAHTHGYSGPDNTNNARQSGGAAVPLGDTPKTTNANTAANAASAYKGSLEGCWRSWEGA
jgi:microcystin-dependent protein